MKFKTLAASLLCILSIGTAASAWSQSLIKVGSTPTGMPFTFLDTNGTAIANQTSTNVADLALVHGVAISLMIDSNPAKGGGPVTLVNTVTMPNQGIAKR